MRARILWVEGKRADSPPFVPALRKKDYIVETVPTGNEALKRMPEFKPDMVVVNAATLRSNGKSICRSLRKNYSTLPIILIVSPEQTFSKDKCANIILVLPFTPRKLINRILQFVPGNDENILHAGHIRLDTVRNQVYCLKKEARLTPRLCRLLHIFMQHPGEVLKRDYLFREIWNTEYLEDTRTLDVHISWLRQAIEANPRQPRFLKTIRKVGYRLDEDGK